MRLFICVLFLSLSGAWNVAAQTYVLDRVVVDPRRAEPLLIPARYDALRIGELVIDGPTPRNHATITIVSQRYRGGMSADDYVDIQIDAISGNSLAQPRLDLVIERTSVRRLTIDRYRTRNAANDPVVNLRVREAATVAILSLDAGRYGDIEVFLDRDWSEGEAGSPASIRTSGISFETFAARGRFRAGVPANLYIDAQIAPTDLYLGPPSLSLRDVNVLSGTVTLERTQQLPAGALAADVQDWCTDHDRRLKLLLSDLQVGGPGGASMMQNDATARLVVNTPSESCAELSLTNMTLDGDLEVNAGIFGEVAIDGLTGSANLGDTTRLSARSIRTLRMIRANVGSLLLLADHQSAYGAPDVPVWGRLEANGVVQMPSEFFNSLDWHLHNPTGGASDLSGVRSFLVDTRWRSYTTQPDESAARRSLYIVLSSDAQNIYGPFVAGAIALFTGFGVDLFWPSVIFVIVLFGPIAAMVAMNWRPGRWPMVRDYLRLLAFPLTANGNHTVPKRYAAMVDLQRIILLFQIALVSLFIQNAILVGV